MQAVILAGGKGTRLTSRLNGRPKPLIDVCGEPLLGRQLDMLARHGVEDVVVLVNHEAAQIADFLDQRQGGPKTRLIDDGEPRGTAGAALACLDVLEDRFFVIYGDTLFDVDLDRMLAAHQESRADATLLLHPNDHPADSDLVEVDQDGWISAFHPYPHRPGSEFRNLVNAALYICEKRALLAWRESPPPLDFAKDLFPALLSAGARLRGYLSFEYIKDLGTPARLDKVERHLANGVVERARAGVPQKVVFVDRDGTLNVLRDYVRTRSDLEMLPGAAAAVRELNEREYRVFVVTNQPVLARGECDFAEMERIHRRLETRLGEAGAWLDGLLVCPHHPDSGFEGEVSELKCDCACRKPGIGMFEKVAASVTVDHERSWMIGDSTADMLAGNRFGLKTVLVRTGEGGRDGKYPGRPDFVVDDIAEAVQLISDFELGRQSALLARSAPATGGGT